MNSQPSSSSSSRQDDYSSPYYESSTPSSFYSASNSHPITQYDELPLPPPPSSSEPPRQPNSKDAPSYPCLYPGCQTSVKFKRCADLEWHIQTVHFPIRYECPFKWCGRVGENAFTRKDHLRDHEREVHMMEVPKVGQRQGSIME